MVQERHSFGLECHILDRTEWSVTRPNCVSVEGKNLKRSDLDEFVQCFHAENRDERKESERFKGFAYDACSSGTRSISIFSGFVTNRSKIARIFHDPDVLALEIAEEPEAALEQFAAIAEDLKR
jgi:type I restriction enzyme M protein